ncbi:MAG TPA: helix-turn-helix domain-containing protein, partial [Candidatus Eisenbacteria bacterium]|nr:helix-turn-helix domain-containing protein [Candidatus Eisenbacteria bacterium]
MTKVISIPSTETTLKRCPINNTFNIVGKRFAILILRNMINSKQNRFNQLLNAIEDGNPKTLSVRLREMETHGLIKRKVYSYEKPVRVEYRPTEKGLALQPMLDAMATYSLKYCSKDVLEENLKKYMKEKLTS